MSKGGISPPGSKEDSRNILVSWKDRAGKTEFCNAEAGVAGAALKIDSPDAETYFPMDQVWYWEYKLSGTRSCPETGQVVPLTLVPRDNFNPIVLQGVETFCMEGETLRVIFLDGRSRNYPIRHLSSWETTK